MANPRAPIASPTRLSAPLPRKKTLSSSSLKSKDSSMVEAARGVSSSVRVRESDKHEERSEAADMVR